MKFTFVGNGDNDPDEVEFYGITFPIGVAVEVTDPAQCAKLAGNNHFREGEAKAAPRVKRPYTKPARPAQAMKIERVPADQLPDD